jgi:hypothetical protein
MGQPHPFFCAALPQLVILHHLYQEKVKKLMMVLQNTKKVLSLALFKDNIIFECKTT